MNEQRTHVIDHTHRLDFHFRPPLGLPQRGIINVEDPDEYRVGDDIVFNGHRCKVTSVFRYQVSFQGVEESFPNDDK